ncbi:unnamed protein product [Malus baccata var. baccata]
MNYIVPSLQVSTVSAELLRYTSRKLLWFAHLYPAATTGERANPIPLEKLNPTKIVRSPVREWAERRQPREGIKESWRFGRECAEWIQRRVGIKERWRFGPTFRRLLNPNGEFCQVWSAVLILICGFAVSVDPLFLYIPIVNIDIKCTRLDRKLKVTALYLRFFTDIFYAYDIIWNVLEDRFNRWRIIKQWLPIVVLAVAPVPQVVILSFTKIIRLPGSYRMMVNSLLVLQYVVRVGRIYQLRKHITQDTPIKWFKGVGEFWIRGAFIIFDFILASHVFGALWYFLSLQRLMDCWKYACRNENGCELGGFYCEDKDTFMRNVTLLNNLCHANPPTATSFDFGIFLDAIQSGILSSTDFPQKFLHCFWWGLRNLSSFGQNLQTSSYAWEDLFAVLINVIGMLFVLIYLNAIVQTHAQSTTELSKENRMLMETRKKRNPQIASWLDENGLHLDLKEKIMTCALNELKADEDMDIKNIHFILPWKDLVVIKRHLCLDTLKKVTKLQNMKEKEFEAFCDYLKPVIHEADTFIIREGEQFDKILFITQGTVRTYTTTSDDVCGSSSAGNTPGDGCFQKGDFYGEELVQAWELYEGTTSRSTKNVKCCTKVEGFTLTIKDMERGIDKIRE